MSVGVLEFRRITLPRAWGIVLSLRSGFPNFLMAIRCQRSTPEAVPSRLVRYSLRPVRT